MIKLVAISDESFDALIGRKSVYSPLATNFVKCNLPDGKYAFVDESGVGFQGIGQSKDGFMNTHVQFKNSLLANCHFILPSHFTLTEEHEELSALLAPFPFEIRASFQSLDDEVMHFAFFDAAGEVSAYFRYYRNRWTRMGPDHEPWRSLLLEYDVKEPGIARLAKKIETFKFSNTTFFSSPGKGLYLP